MLTWFYCLDIIDAVLLVLAVSMVFLGLKAVWGERRCWRPVVGSMAVIWFLMIGYVTLASREPEEQLGAHWVPFYSYYLGLSGINKEMLRSCFMNVILFYPAGLLAGGAWMLRGLVWKRVVLLAAVGFGVSVSVEVLQYFLLLGLAEVDDVIHNTLGMVIGAVVGGASTGGFRMRRRGW